MDYVVELTTDRKTNRRADINYDNVMPVSFQDARDLLEDFVGAHGGQVKGWFHYGGKRRVGSAVVNMSPATAEALEDHNVALLETPEQEPFVARIAGTAFDIHPRKDIRISASEPKGAECTI